MKRDRRKARRVGSGVHLFTGLFIASFLVVIFVFRLEPGQSEALKSEIAPAQYTLRLSGPISPSSAGTILALSDGLFLREGLSISLVAGADDSDAISAVAADENTIGLASAAGFLKARAEGIPIVAFAASYIVNSAEFYSLPRISVLSPSDLEGKRIGYRPGPEISTLLQAFVARNGIAQSKLQLVETDKPLQDLVDQKIDVLVGHRDIEGQELDRLNVDYRSLSPDSFGIHFAGPVYFAHQRAFSKQRNLQKFLIATANGWKAAYSDYERTVPIIARAIHAPPPPPLISRLMDAQRHLLRPFGARFGELDSRRLQVLQAQLLQRRIIREPIDLTRAIDYDVLKEAYRREANTLNRIEP